MSPALQSQPCPARGICALFLAHGALPALPIEAVPCFLACRKVIHGGECSLRFNPHGCPFLRDKMRMNFVWFHVQMLVFSCHARWRDDLRALRRLLHTHVDVNGCREHVCLLRSMIGRIRTSFGRSKLQQYPGVRFVSRVRARAHPLSVVSCASAMLPGQW